MIETSVWSVTEHTFVDFWACFTADKELYNFSPELRVPNTELWNIERAENFKNSQKLSKISKKFLKLKKTYQNDVEETLKALK